MGVLRSHFSRYRQIRCESAGIVARLSIYLPIARQSQRFATGPRLAHSHSHSWPPLKQQMRFRRGRDKI
jgi:hypothetical protein